MKILIHQIADRGGELCRTQQKDGRMKARMNTEERRHYTIEDVREGLIQEMLEGEL